LTLLLHKVSFIIKTHFQPSRQTLYTGHVKLFAAASELFTPAGFQLVVVSKTASSKCIFQGIKKTEVEGRTKENKFKVQTSACKFMAIVFWDSEGILLVEFLERCATII
jgi:hypothetical protein